MVLIEFKYALDQDLNFEKLQSVMKLGFLFCFLNFDVLISFYSKFFWFLFYIKLSLVNFI